ncbi:hypothetical protein FEM48_ZijujUnG0015700 [Ziziphus jujuba var. spinosa]|uniref:PORR domain-containing protein n=1 Tax=Ziziphus jujuba var. spinosa TaxID=714518 RepID=A0A978U9V8_ZIZJJ|nr:hypothetical protein FEM48_ZijujUnG0015700 [Ziziphus jujuba var. spinosa]
MLRRMAPRFSSIQELDLSQTVSQSFYPSVTDSDLSEVLGLVDWDPKLAVSSLEIGFMVDEEMAKRAFKFSMKHDKDLDLDEDETRKLNLLNMLSLVLPYSDGSKLSPNLLGSNYAVHLHGNTNIIDTIEAKRHGYTVNESNVGNVTTSLHTYCHITQDGLPGSKSNGNTKQQQCMLNMKLLEGNLSTSSACQQADPTTSSHQNAAVFDIRNNCPFTVWAATIPGGGRKLDRGQTWSINVKAGTTQARIWARTKCNFDGAGRGKCETGDCGGILQCQAYGQPPNTLAEYALNQFNNLDFIDISLVDGFNVPMEFSPTSGGCSKVIRCTADINGQCPNELRAPGGCNNPCTVFKTDQYCCNSGSCGPTRYSKFFKDRCPDAYSYPKDDATSTFTCPGGTNYKVIFCP